MKTTPSLLREKGYPSETGTAAGTREPGEVSNRLSLDPSAFPITQAWEDGKEYTLVVKVNQISPGEFEVLEATENGATEEAEPVEETEAMPMMNGKSKNPAVAGLME